MINELFTLCAIYNLNYFIGNMYTMCYVSFTLCAMYDEHYVLLSDMYIQYSNLKFKTKIQIKTEIKVQVYN